MKQNSWKFELVKLINFYKLHVLSNLVNWLSNSFEFMNDGEAVSVDLWGGNQTWTPPSPSLSLSLSLSHFSVKTFSPIYIKLCSFAPIRPKHLVKLLSKQNQALSIYPIQSSKNLILILNSTFICFETIWSWFNKPRMSLMLVVSNFAPRRCE